jgi:hypothetical protein
MSNGNIDFDHAKRVTHEELARELSDMFNGIAKTAMRASAEFSDLQGDHVYAKFQQAHSTVTTMVDDAMRGLNKATVTILKFAILSVHEDSQDEDDAEE